MGYKDVIEKGWHKILPKKEKYTMKDVDKVLLRSLFDNKINDGKTFTLEEAGFIVMCTAIFHGTDYSQTILKLRRNSDALLEKLKR